MKPEDSGVASGESEQTEPEIQATEQAIVGGSAFENELLKLAKEEGHELGDEAKSPAASDEAEPEPAEPAEPDAEGVPEGEDAAPEEEPKEELKPAAKGDKLVPLREVLEERDKKKRANERADRAEERIQELERYVAQVSGPQPTADNKFADVNDLTQLDRLERSYDQWIDIANENPDGAENVYLGKNPDGTEKREDLTREQMAFFKAKAEKAIRREIPERRKYLEARIQQDRAAIELYPELKNQESEFSQRVNELLYLITTGQAQKHPEVALWVARAVKGMEVERASNGATDPDAARIVKSAKQKIAPTPTRTRSIPERRTGGSSVNLEKAAKELEEKGTPEAGEKYLEALFSQRQGSGPRAVTT